HRPRVEVRVEVALGHHLSAGGDGERGAGLDPPDGPVQRLRLRDVLQHQVVLERLVVHLLGDPERVDQMQQALLLAGESRATGAGGVERSEEHTSELQSRENLVCRLLLEKKKKKKK